MLASDDEYEQENTSHSSYVHELRNAAVKGIRPVTVHQLLDATRPHSEAPYSIGGVDVWHVSIVAQLVSSRIAGTCVFYHLEDGTSGDYILAKQWHSDVVEVLPDTEQYYVQVVGQLEKTPIGTRNVLTVASIRRVTDAHQMFFHWMEAAYVTLCFERGPPPLTSAHTDLEPRLVEIEPGRIPASGAPTTPPRAAQLRSLSGNAPPTPFTPSNCIGQRTYAAPQPRTTLKNGPIPKRTEPPAPSQSRPLTPESPVRKPPHTSGNIASSSRTQPRPGSREARRASGIKRDPYAHLTVLQRAILLQILNDQTAQGADVSAIARGTSHHNATAEQIGDALDSLLEQGYIETTVDASHYAMRSSHYPTNT